MSRTEDYLHMRCVGNFYGVLDLCYLDLVTARVVRRTSQIVISLQPQLLINVKISNNGGELYSLSIRSPHFNWIQDFSAFDELLTITPGNNGRLYAIAPIRALVFALDAYTGNVLWQKNIGPLSKTDCSPVIDSNGWISLGSLDEFLYSFSPTGVLKKFPKATVLDSVVQVSPSLDCSGYAVYISQTHMEGQISRVIGEYTYISAMKPMNAVFTLLVPATGFIHWTGTYTDQSMPLPSESDLHHFVLDESILLAFITADNMGSPLSCRTTSQKTASSCSQARIKHLSIYTVIAVLAGLVRFCCIFWRKRKLQDQDHGKFTVTELEKKAAEEPAGNEVVEKLGDMVRERGKE